MSLKRLVLFVEGKGDETAIPNLAGKILKHLGGTDVLFVDKSPFRVKGLGHLVKNDAREWHRYLCDAAKTRPELAAVLLVLDGDLDRVPSTWKEYAQSHISSEFCAFHVASALARSARAARAGDSFSLGCVFVMKEFEAWLLAGIESLRGAKLSEGRGIVPANAQVPAFNLEGRRNAKQELRRIVPEYSETLDQGELAKHLDIQQVSGRCRSFRRFESAIKRLIQDVRTSACSVTPVE